MNVRAAVGLSALMLTGCLGDFLADPDELDLTPIAFETVDPGTGFTCGLASGGVPYCWGLLGHLLFPDDAFASGVQAVPAPLETSLRFDRLTVGAQHACALTSDGQAYCWGYNLSGQLGSTAAAEDCGFEGEPQPCSGAPLAVAGGIRFAALSAGGQHTCGIAVSGEAYCWGGAFGDVLGTTEPLDVCGFFESPCAAEPALVAGGLTFTTVDAGGGHTCAVTEDETAYCWGSFAPALGIGPVDESAVPEGCEVAQFSVLGTTLGRCRWPVLPVAGGLAFASVSLGGDLGSLGSHTCAVTLDGEGYCWGSNAVGQLGTQAVGDPVAYGDPNAIAPVPVPVDGGHQFSQIHAGPDYTCGVTTQGGAFCWGQGGDFSIGSVESSDPTLIASPLGFVPSTFDGPHVAPVPGSVSTGVATVGVWTGGFASGERHTCAVGADGAAFCWGSNFEGQLGDGTRQSTAVPVQVAGEANDES